MASIYLRGANRTAQWYQNAYAGATFTKLDKFLIHTTETIGWPGYGGGASAPNATYNPRTREIRQHFGINRSARALRDPSNTAVRENRDNIFQLEIICYSDYALAQRVGGLWVGDLTTSHMRDIAAMILQCGREWKLPMKSTVTWREGRKTYYDNVRLSGPQFDSYSGILGHVHASGNTHWDPGGFRYSQLNAALNWQLANHPVYGSGITLPPGSGVIIDPVEVLMSWNEKLVPTDLAKSRTPDSYSTRAGEVLMHVLGLTYEGNHGKIVPNATTKKAFPDVPDEGYSSRVYNRANYGHLRFLRRDMDRALALLELLVAGGKGRDEVLDHLHAELQTARDDRMEFADQLDAAFILLDSIRALAQEAASGGVDPEFVVGQIRQLIHTATAPPEITVAAEEA